MAKYYHIDNDIKTDLRKIMSLPCGTIELKYKDKQYIVLQFNICSPVDEQEYEIHGIGDEYNGKMFETLPKRRLSFNELVEFFEPSKDSKETQPQSPSKSAKTVPVNTAKARCSFAV